MIYKSDLVIKLFTLFPTFRMVIFYNIISILHNVFTAHEIFATMLLDETYLLIQIFCQKKQTKLFMPI